MPPARRRALAVALGVGVALILALGVELAARGAEADRVPDLSVPLPQGEGLLMEPHPYLLWEHSPGERQEYGVSVHINSLGLRGPEPVIPKPAGVLRILATGDSSVYGFGVEDDATFVREAADRLGGSAGGIEGWTAALPGYSTLQTLNLLRMRALSLEPDLVVVANLWSDHATEARPDAELLELYVRHDRSLRGAVARVLRRSASYRLLDWELGVRRGVRARARAGWAPSTDPSRETSQRVPVGDYRANLESIVRLTGDHGAEVVFLVLPHPDDLAERGAGRAAYPRYRQAMVEVAQGHGAPLVHGGDVFTQALAERPDLPPGDLWLDNIHPTALGHRLLGDALALSLAGWPESYRVGGTP